MNIEEQIKPVDWAKEHGVKSDFVVKLLRDNGVKVLTQVSKVNASEFAKIESAVAEEKKKQDSRSKNLAQKKASSSDADASADDKKSTATTTKNGVKIRLKKATTTKAKPAAEKPTATKATKATAPAEVEAPKAPVADKPAVPEVKPVETPKEVVKKPEALADSAAAKVDAKPEVKSEPVVKTDPKPVAPPKPAPAPAPNMMSSSTELKQPPMKAQVFKPDAAILARIAKSQQQQQGGRGPGNRRPGGPGAKGPGNAQGYTGTFGPRNGGNGQDRGNGGFRSGQNGGRGGFGGGRSSGFSGGSMQDAFNASNGGTGFPMGSAQGGKGGNAKGQNGRHGGDKNRRGNNGRDRQEQQKEQQQEMVRQNVSRVMADLSKKPVKKVYRKEHNDTDAGEEKKILKTSDFITVGELAGLMDQMPARVIAKCMEMGMMVTINARLDFETIQILADEFGFEAQLMEEYEEAVLGVEEESTENLQPRHPVVT